MPRTEVLFYQETNGETPFIEWIEGLPPEGAVTCAARLARLERLGHEIRRPEADYLRDGIYELRARNQGVNYRMLYFFHGKVAIVVSHGFSKQQAAVPSREIERALRRKAAFEADPAAHTFRPGSA